MTAVQHDPAGEYRAALADDVRSPGAATEFLAESLSTFEMAQRDDRETQQRAVVAHGIART